MADQQIASQFERAAETLHDVLLGGFIEIHHDVAAKDHVKQAPVRERLNQVEAGEFDGLPDFGLDLVETLAFAFAAQKISAPPGLGGNSRKRSSG